MKKFLILILSLSLVLGLVACGSSNSGSTSDSIPKSESTVPDEESGALTEKPTGTKSGKTLVVYYSATGNTEKVANYITSVTGADVFELKPVNAYTDTDLNYNDDSSRVVREHDNPDEQNIELLTSTVKNWNKYDTVFIGYPIWWHIAAWPVNSFIKANDFTDKTVIPFCTSASSDLGESGKLLKEMAGTGKWLEGQRFGSSVSESTVSSWIENLGL